jgi:hypothetical protein
MTSKLLSLDALSILQPTADLTRHRLRHGLVATSTYSNELSHEMSYNAAPCEEAVPYHETVNLADEPSSERMLSRNSATCCSLNRSQYLYFMDSSCFRFLFGDISCRTLSCLARLGFS